MGVIGCSARADRFAYVRLVAGHPSHLLVGESLSHVLLLYLLVPAAGIPATRSVPISTVPCRSSGRTREHPGRCPGPDRVTPCASGRPEGQMPRSRTLVPRHVRRKNLNNPNEPWFSVRICAPGRGAAVYGAAPRGCHRLTPRRGGGRSRSLATPSRRPSALATCPPGHVCRQASARGQRATPRIAGGPGRRARASTGTAAARKRQGGSGGVRSARHRSGGSPMLRTHQPDNIRTVTVRAVRHSGSSFPNDRWHRL